MDLMRHLGHRLHAWSQTFVESAARCMMPPEGSAHEPRFYVTAWDGPRAGECNQDTIALSHLRALVEVDAIPRDVLVWPVQDGTQWRRVAEVIPEVDANQLTVL